MTERAFSHPVHVKVCHNFSAEVLFWNKRRKIIEGGTAEIG